MSYEKHVLFTLREHLASPPFFLGLVNVLFFLFLVLCRVVCVSFLFLVFVLWHVPKVTGVSDWPCLIAPSDLSNVCIYIQNVHCIGLLVYGQNRVEFLNAIAGRLIC